MHELTGREVGLALPSNWENSSRGPHGGSRTSSPGHVGMEELQLK